MKSGSARCGRTPRGFSWHFATASCGDPERHGLERKSWRAVTNTLTSFLDTEERLARVIVWIRQEDDTRRRRERSFHVNDEVLLIFSIRHLGGLPHLRRSQIEGILLPDGRLHFEEIRSFSLLNAKVVVLRVGRS